MVDWLMIADDREKYAAYLCSREWGVLKKAVHERAGGVCERCCIHRIDHVHHLTYQRKYSERLEDLQGLCKPCHEFTHGLSAIDPAELTRIWNLIYPLVDQLVVQRLREHEERMFLNGQYRTLDPTRQRLVEDRQREIAERARCQELKAQMQGTKTHQEARAILSKLKTQ